MPRLFVLFLLLLAACSPAPVPARRALKAVSAPPDAAARRAIAAALATTGPEGVRRAGLVHVSPWPDDADRFGFRARYQAEVARSGWALREEVRGSMDLHTGRVEVDGLRPASPPPCPFGQDQRQIVHVSPTPSGL